VGRLPLDKGSADVDHRYVRAVHIRHRESRHQAVQRSLRVHLLRRHVGCRCVTRYLLRVCRCTTDSCSDNITLTSLIVGRLLYVGRKSKKHLGVSTNIYNSVATIMYAFFRFRSVPRLPDGAALRVRFPTLSQRRHSSLSTASQTQRHKRYSHWSHRLRSVHSTSWDAGTMLTEATGDEPDACPLARRAGQRARWYHCAGTSSRNPAHIPTVWKQSPDGRHGGDRRGHQRRANEAVSHDLH
jgi:hypothetical protein